MKQQGCEGFVPPETHPLAGAAKAWVEEREKTATMGAEAPEKHWSMRHPVVQSVLCTAGAKRRAD